MGTRKELKKFSLRWELPKVGTGGRSPPSDLGLCNWSQGLKNLLGVLGGEAPQLGLGLGSFILLNNLRGI